MGGHRPDVVYTCAIIIHSLHQTLLDRLSNRFIRKCFLSVHTINVLLCTGNPIFETDTQTGKG